MLLQLALLCDVLTDRLEVLDGVLSGPMVQHSPHSQQRHVVKQSEYRVPRLVDGEDYCFSLFCHPECEVKNDRDVSFASRFSI